MPPKFATRNFFQNLITCPCLGIKEAKQHYLLLNQNLEAVSELIWESWHSSIYSSVSWKETVIKMTSKATYWMKKKKKKEISLTTKKKKKKSSYVQRRIKSSLPSLSKYEWLYTVFGAIFTFLCVVSRF